MTTPLYIVTREGVYRHEILAIFNSQKDAEDLTKDLAENDRDSYHDYHVSSILLNTRVEDATFLSSTRKKD
jgi:hypothetical protein